MKYILYVLIISFSYSRLLLNDRCVAYAQSTPEINVVNPLASSKKVQHRLDRILGDGKRVTVTQVTEAILQLIVDDLKVQRLDQISPLAIRAIVPRSPLSSSLSIWAEARLNAILHQKSSIEVQECIACKGQQTSVKEENFIITKGILKSTRKGNLKNESSVQSYLEMTLWWDPDQQVLTSRAKLYTHTDQLLWSEDYRSGEIGQLAKRGLKEISVETSMGKYQKLGTLRKADILRLNEITFGVGIRQGQGLASSALSLGYGYGVFFGVESKHLLLFKGVSSLASNRHFNDLIADYRIRLSKASRPGYGSSVKSKSLYASRGLWLSGRFGIPFSPLISGLLLGSGLHYMSQYKVGLGANLNYAFGFDHRTGTEPGGVATNLTILINF